MSLRRVHVQFPDIDVDCPKCGETQVLSGYDFEPTGFSASYGRSTDVLCERCEHEFDVFVGGQHATSTPQ